MKLNSLVVKKIFYSLQGEGSKQGEACIFIRLAGCNLNCPFCDTDHSGGKVMSIKEIVKEISQYNCSWIVWTGGEPTLQLTNKIISQFPKKYLHAIETNGTNYVPSLINYISCSPKISNLILKKNFNWIDEIRFPVDVTTEQGLENYVKLSSFSLIDLPNCKYYYISPIFTGDKKTTVNIANIIACLDLIKKNPLWRLSIQMHKIINIE